MDTNTAIQILEIESANLGVDIGTKTNLKAAIDLAIQQLQGKLATDITAEITPLQARVSDLQTQLDAEKAKTAEASPMTPIK